MILMMVLSVNVPVFRKFADMRALLMHPYVLVFFGGGAGKCTTLRSSAD